MSSLEVNGVNCSFSKAEYWNQNIFNIVCQTVDDPTLFMIAKFAYKVETSGPPTPFVVGNKLVLLINGYTGKLGWASEGPLNAFLKSWEVPFPTKKDIVSWNQESSQFRDNFLKILKAEPLPFYSKYEYEHEFSDVRENEISGIYFIQSLKVINGEKNRFVAEHSIVFPKNTKSPRVFEAVLFNSRISFSEVSSEYSEEYVM